ncbi:hypothetical protein Srufu_032520 [Streptomyces libani subsp. rufus]|nr:hypothetical protein Srufu_032520 [Streptomyces libani subsp. rufus]
MTGASSRSVRNSSGALKGQDRFMGMGLAAVRAPVAGSGPVVESGLVVGCVLVIGQSFPKGATDRGSGQRGRHSGAYRRSAGGRATPGMR